MSDDANKSVLFVKKKDSQKGDLWNTLTNKRIIKQHGGFDIPEGDLHAIQKYNNPIEGKQSSPDETKEALSEIEKEIKELKEKDNHASLPPQSPHVDRKQFTNKPDNYQDQDDDL